MKLPYHTLHSLTCSFQSFGELGEMAKSEMISVLGPGRLATAMKLRAGRSIQPKLAPS